MSFPLKVRPNAAAVDISAPAGFEVILKDASVKKKSGPVNLTITVGTAAPAVVALDGRNARKARLSTTAASSVTVTIGATGSGPNAGVVKVNGKVTQLGSRPVEGDTSSSSDEDEEIVTDDRGRVVSRRTSVHRRRHRVHKK